MIITDSHKFHGWWKLSWMRSLKAKLRGHISLCPSVVDDFWMISIRLALQVFDRDFSRFSCTARGPECSDTFRVSVEHVQTSVFPFARFRVSWNIKILNRFENLKKTTCILEHVMPRFVRKSNLPRPLQRFLVLHLEQVWSRYKRQRAGAKDCTIGVFETPKKRSRHWNSSKI